MSIFLSAIIGYLFGSVSCAIILTRLIMKKDVRDYGSFNAGATNVARVFGVKLGLLTFACDFAKTAAAMLLGRLVGGETGLLAAGASCIVGHCFPLFFGFRGGKAVTVGAAVSFFLDWRLFLAILTVFAIVAFISKIVSLASMSSALSLPIFQIIFGIRDIRYIILGCFLALMVFFMHRSNIRRLLRGEEKPIKFNKD